MTSAFCKTIVPPLRTTLFLLCIIPLFALGAESDFCRLQEWHAPKIRFNNIAASEALKRIADLAPKSKEGKSIFRYVFVPYKPDAAMRDPEISWQSNQELFIDLIGGIAQAAAWKITLKDYIYVFSDETNPEIK